MIEGTNEEEFKGIINEETEVDIEDLSFEDQLDGAILDYQEGDIIKGVVRSIEKSGVLVDIKYKSDGFILNSELSNEPNVSAAEVLKEGDETHVYIEKLESKEGYTVLSRKRAEYELAWGEISEYSKQKDTVEVYVSSKVGGGLVADFKGIKGFIPASQLLKEQDQSFDDFLGQRLEVAVLKVDRRRKKVIFSHKQVRNKIQREEMDRLFEDLEVGQTRTGKVTSVKDFGVFVDMGGAEGLVHISEMSWSRVKHPSDVVSVGDEVRVFILGIDRENRKISLGMKQLEEDPWVQIIDKYEVGQIIEGTISRVVAFGAFIQIEENLEGLIHISELSYDHINKVENIVQVGDTVEARIIKLVPEEQKVGLSLKGLDAGKTSE